MNTKKLLSFVLCAVILLSGFYIFEKTPIAIGGAMVVAYESEKPVAPAEGDFTYKKLPVNSPTMVTILTYKGKETKIILPEKLGGLPVTSISATAFAGNENLTYVKLPSTLTTFSGKTFNMCSSLTTIEVASTNKTFTSIDGVVYRKDATAGSPTYGKPVTLVAFPAGKSGHFTVPDGIKTIGAFAFDHCYNLTSVDMYNTVTEIQTNAFSFCWNINKIRLSDNLTTLGNQALAYCDSLKRIDLPATISSIGTDAVLGAIDSDNNKVYYFTNGISCGKGSYAYDYLVKQHLPKNIILEANRTITDNDTAVKLIDADNILPKNAIMDIDVKVVPLTDVQKLFPVRYAEAYAFDISVTKNGAPYTLPGNIIISFENVCPGAIPSATKIYKQIGEKLVPFNGSAHTPIVCTQVTEGGRFIVLVNNDFSLKGDVDGDGIVSLVDVKTVLHASVGTLALTSEQAAAANADNSKDGKITTSDARKVLRLAGGMD